MQPDVAFVRVDFAAGARVSPTGPTLPLVVTPTTMGDELNVGVTYRATGFPVLRSRA